MLQGIGKKTVQAASLLLALGWAEAATGAPQKGSFQVVGIGPGDADLLTLRAVNAIKDAEVVFCRAKTKDKLASAIDFSGKQVIDGYNVIFWHYGKECPKNEVRHAKQRLSCEEYHQKQAEFAKLEEDRGEEHES